jgi:hypothetical protein
MYVIIVCEKGDYGFIVDRKNNVSAFKTLSEAIRAFMHQGDVCSLLYSTHFKPRAAAVTEETFRDYMPEKPRVVLSQQFFGSCRFVVLDPEKGKELYEKSEVINE